MGGPLEGVRVLDLGRYQAGPRCGLMLYRLGADVIKIEPPKGEESRTNGQHYWVQYNSGKRSLGLNLYSDEGKNILSELVKTADIFIQNFRPGVIGKIGFSYEKLKELNPKIVMVNVSAYGQFGPYKDRVGFDPIGQAISGLMTTQGTEGMDPFKCSFPLIDRITALHATIGALSALWESRISGEGQSLDVCLADTGYTTAEIPISTYLTTGAAPRRTGNGNTFTNTYQCKDGWVYLISTGPRMWKRAAEVVGKKEWIDDERYATRQGRTENAVEIEEYLSQWFSEKTRDEVINLFSPHGVPIQKINTIAEAAHDPHMRERNIIEEIDDYITDAPNVGRINAIGDIFHFSRSGYQIGHAPLPGEHSREVLCELLNLSEEELDALHAEEVI